jgi:O-antigen/teichoic acid export membrane protein
LYDDRYHRGGTVAAFLAIGSWFATISSSYGVVLLAAGRPKALSAANAAKVLSFTAFLWFAAARFGIEGAALVMGLSELVFLVVAQVAARREQVVTLGADVGITVGAAALVGAYLGLHHLLLDLSGSRVLALATTVAAALALTAVLAKKVKLLSSDQAGTRPT